VAMRDTAAAEACADHLFGHQWEEGATAKVEPAQKIPNHWKLEWHGSPHRLEILVWLFFGNSAGFGLVRN
jgi:hypothetical protein